MGAPALASPAGKLSQRVAWEWSTQRGDRLETSPTASLEAGFVSSRAGQWGTTSSFHDYPRSLSSPPRVTNSKACRDRQEVFVGNAGRCVRQ